MEDGLLDFSSLIRFEPAQIFNSDWAGFRGADQPHAVGDMDWAEHRVGPQRIQGAHAWRTMRRNEVRLLSNFDLPGSDCDIFYGLHSPVTRKGKDLQPPGGWYPDQVLTPEEAVRAYTTWAPGPSSSTMKRGSFGRGCGAT